MDEMDKMIFCPGRFFPLVFSRVDKIGQPWQRVLKEVFVSLATVKLGVYDAVIQYNEGYQGCLKELSTLSIKNPGCFTVNGYQKLNSTRINESKCHATPVSQKRRKVLRGIRKKIITVLDKTDGELYKSGAF